MPCARCCGLPRGRPRGAGVASLRGQRRAPIRAGGIYLVSEPLVRRSQKNHKPLKKLVGAAGFEPTTPSPPD